MIDPLDPDRVPHATLAEAAHAVHGTGLPPTRGELALAVALPELGQREIAGPRANPRILAYLAGCIRRGAPLGLASDEIAWCAAFVGWCEQGQGFVWRAAVAEYVADAVADGTWRDLGYDPCPGDLPVWKRLGEDPRRGGRGHIGRAMTALDASGRFDCLEGNHDNAVVIVERDCHDPELVGWVCRSC